MSNHNECMKQEKRRHGKEERRSVELNVKQTVSDLTSRLNYTCYVVTTGTRKCSLSSIIIHVRFNNMRSSLVCIQDELLVSE